MRRSFLAIASQYKTSLLKLYKILLSTRTGMLSYYVILFTRLTLTFLNCTVLVHYELHRESVPWLVSSIPTTTKTKRWWCLLVYSVEDCSCVLIRGLVYGRSIVFVSVRVYVCVCERERERESEDGTDPGRIRIRVIEPDGNEWYNVDRTNNFGRSLFPGVAVTDTYRSEPKQQRRRQRRPKQNPSKNRKKCNDGQ